jgi:cytochrome c oxidase subunit II
MRMSRELRRLLLTWLILSAIATPLVAIFIGPHLPPGKQADAGAGQVTDFTVSTAVATPIIILILSFLVYVLIAFRQKGTEIQDGPRIYGDRTAQTVWLATSVLIVAGLCAFAITRLLEPGASGSGQGPTPLSVLKPVSNRSTLPVQVIGQQWQFSYRYPTYGGVETPHLVLPAGRTIELHVTSLDVVHSFWAYDLGVKADANPGVDNVAYVEPRHTGTFNVRCAELCGIWHGFMFDKGQIVTPSRFTAWIRQQQKTFAPSKRYLPPYRETYLPDPQRQAG